MTEAEHRDRVGKKALNCGNVFSDNELKLLLAEGLLPTIRSQVLHHLMTHPRVAFNELTQYAEGVGTAYRGAINYQAVAGSR